MLEGHSGSVKSVAFSPDGEQVVSGSRETVRLWDATTGVSLQTLEGHSNDVYSVVFSPDGKQSCLDLGIKRCDFGTLSREHRSNRSMATINASSQWPFPQTATGRVWILG
jgi:WD40 repeat protein